VILRLPCAAREVVACAHHRSQRPAGEPHRPDGGIGASTVHLHDLLAEDLRTMNTIAPGQEPLICSVVVARNEQATLEICLAAIRRELDSVGGGEILLVDSGSTDRTPELGLQAGCQVISVRRASRMCPSAMRYLGAQRTGWGCT